MSSARVNSKFLRPICTASAKHSIALAVALCCRTWYCVFAESGRYGRRGILLLDDVPSLNAKPDLLVSKHAFCTLHLSCKWLFRASNL